MGIRKQYKQVHMSISLKIFCALPALLLLNAEICALKFHCCCCCKNNWYKACSLVVSFCLHFVEIFTLLCFNLKAQYAKTEMKLYICLLIVDLQGTWLQYYFQLLGKSFFLHYWIGPSAIVLLWITDRVRDRDRCSLRNANYLAMYSIVWIDR